MVIPDDSRPLVTVSTLLEILGDRMWCASVDTIANVSTLLEILDRRVLLPV